MLVATLDATSELTSAPMDFVLSVIGVISRSSTPAFSTTPPKARAVTISQIVLSMLSMPPRLASMYMPVPAISQAMIAPIGLVALEGARQREDAGADHSADDHHRQREGRQTVGLAGRSSGITLSLRRHQNLQPNFRAAPTCQAWKLAPGAFDQMRS